MHLTHPCHQDGEHCSCQPDRPTPATNRKPTAPAATLLHRRDASASYFSSSFSSHNSCSWSSWIPRCSTGACHDAVRLGQADDPSTRDPPPMSQETHTRPPPPPPCRPRYIRHRGRRARPPENPPAPSPAKACGRSRRSRSTPRSRTRSGRTVCHRRRRGHRTSG